MPRARFPVLPARFPAPRSWFYRHISGMLPRCGAYTVQPLRGDLGESVAPGAVGDPQDWDFPRGSPTCEVHTGEDPQGSVLRCLCLRRNLGSLEPRFVLSVLQKEPGGSLEPSICAKEGLWTPDFHPSPCWEGTRLRCAENSGFPFG